MTDFDELNSLFKDARREQFRAKEAAAARKAIHDGEKPRQPQEALPQELYTKPENWIAGRGIALIHEGTQTLLGNFREYTHATVAGCRKLLLEPTPIQIDAQEHVAGDWWIAEVRSVVKREEWTKKYLAVLDLHLDKLGVHAPAVSVEAHVAYGGIQRCELTRPYTFAATGETVGQLLELPAGTNLLPVMSRDSKLNLRKEIGL